MANVRQIILDSTNLGHEQWVRRPQSIWSSVLSLQILYFSSFLNTNCLMSSIRQSERFSTSKKEFECVGASYLLILQKEAPTTDISWVFFSGDWSKSSNIAERHLPQEFADLSGIETAEEKCSKSSENWIPF